MSVAVSALNVELAQATDRAGIAGHPRGLTTLFFTEFWERFSYYGMRALLVLYMTAATDAGGLAFSREKATQIYGLYTASVYVTCVVGGWIADNILGSRRAVFWGGVVIALGHFSMAFKPLPFFYGGMVLIAVGTGLLKPNVSAIVGALYGQGDARRDAGFSIFYMGINLGAMLAPLVCGTLGQRVDWHLGFACAGVGMVFGLIQFTVHRERLAHVGNRPEKKKSMSGEHASAALTSDEFKQLAFVFALFVFSMMFWAGFEQSGSSLTLFADRLTRNSIFGLEFPSSWFQSVNSVFILTLAPVFSWFWVKLGSRQPGSAMKFAYGLFLVGVGYLVMTAATFFTDGSKVGPLWLVGMYFIHTVGELCVSPVGLSTVTKAAPLRFVGMMMGMWFVFTAFGNYFAGTIAGFFNPEAGWGGVRTFFALLAVGLIVGAVLMALLAPSLKKMVGRDV